jgi:hypothetical protein
VFIIRQELRADFEAIFLPRLAGKIEVDFAIQALYSYVPEDLGPVQRTKPWGTGHAMLCAKEHTQTPFAVINADDFYGRDAFQAMGQFLQTDTNETLHAMVGYEVKNTLSEFGSVSRGVCATDDSDNLMSVVERTKIYQKDGIIVYEEPEGLTPLDPQTPVSMNFWGFKPGVFEPLQRQFETYARANFDIPKAEFYIPTVMMQLIQTGEGACRVFRSQSEWFGVTYPEDKPTVKKSLQRLHDSGAYPDQLWS